MLDFLVIKMKGLKWRFRVLDSRPYPGCVLNKLRIIDVIIIDKSWIITII